MVVFSPEVTQKFKEIRVFKKAVIQSSGKIQLCTTVPRQFGGFREMTELLFLTKMETT